MSTLRTRLCAALAAMACGAAGLGLEVLLLSSAGLALGYGASLALGLAVFLTAWSLGAFAWSRARGDAARNLRALGVALAVWAPVSVAATLYAGDALAGGWLAGLVAVLAIGVAGFLQGGFLPLLARGGKSSAALLFAASFAGAALGSVWIADGLVGEWGRYVAAAAAGGVALVAGIVGAIGAVGAVGADRDAETQSMTWERAQGRALPMLVVAAGTAAMTALQWIALRLGVLWFGGMQPALVSITCATLIALALGAALIPRVVPQGVMGVVCGLALCALGSCWPFWASGAMQALGEDLPLIVRALVLCGPALLPFGALVPLVHRSLGGESGERLGRVLLPEALGAALGIPLVHTWVVPSFGLSGAIAAALVACALAALACAGARRAAIALALACAGLAVWAARSPSPALASPPLANPALSVRAFREDRDFAVAVVDDGMLGERTLLTDGFRAAGTGAEYRYMHALGHLPVLLHPHPERVAVLALGTGTTLGSVALHSDVERIEVLELSRAVVELAPHFSAKNHGLLEQPVFVSAVSEQPDARIVVRLGDGRHSLARVRARYDVITMEPLLPDSPFAVYLYTAEFYARARAALRSGGIVCQWIPPHALEPATFDALLDAFAHSFAWSGAWLFGTQLVLIGAEHEPRVSELPFASVGTPLADALRELGLVDTRALAARFVGKLALGPARRALRDADPWIVYAPRRSGAALLGDLPLNLKRLRDLRTDESRAWAGQLGEGALAAWNAGNLLRDARTAHARSEAALRGLRMPASDPQDVELELARARSGAPGDAELAELEAEVAFLSELRAGVGLLTLDSSRASALRALDSLTSAAQRRPERADVHLYVAIALERIESPAAVKALARALSTCPRLEETPEGARAKLLGLSSQLWTRARASAPPVR